MELSKLEVMHDADRAQVAWSLGSYISSRMSDNNKIDLYQLFGYYVELVFEKNGRLHKAECLKATEVEKVYGAQAVERSISA